MGRLVARLPILLAALLVAGGLALVPRCLVRDRATEPPGPPLVAPGPEADGGCPPGLGEAAVAFRDRPFRVRGRVTDPRGRPVPAEVTVIGVDDVGPRGRSRADGTFGISLASPEPVRVGLAAEGLRSTVSARIAPVPGGDLDLGTVRLRPGASLEGVVVDEAGVAVAGAALDVEPDEGREVPGWGELAAATPRWDRLRTDRQGTFLVDGLPEGRWRVRVRAGARGDARAVVADGLATGDPAARVVVPRRLVAQRYRVHVRVFGPDGSPVAGTRVRVVHPHDAVHSGRLEGTMDVEAFHPGPTWLLVVGAVDGAGRTMEVAPAAVRLDPSRRDLDVYLRPGTPLEGTADADGRPVETALVLEGRLRSDGTAVPPEGPGDVGEDWVRLALPLASGPDGTLRPVSLPAGRLRLATEPEAPWSVVGPPFVAAGEGPVRVSLRHRGAVEAVLEGPGEGVLEEATVRLWEERGGGDHLEASFTTCGASGTLGFRRSVRTEGPYALAVEALLSGESLRPAEVRGLLPGGPPVRVPLQRGLAAEGTVLDAEGRPVADAEVRGVPREPAGAGGPRARCDAAGRFRLGGLAPGTWRLVGRGRGLYGVLDVTVGSEAVEGVRLVATPGLLLSGRLHPAPRGTTAGFAIDAFDEAGRSSGAPVEGPSEDGWFSVGPLPPGRWRLHAWPAEAGAGTACALTEPLAPGRRGLDVFLRPGSRVRGRVVDAQGVPVPGTSVTARAPGLARTAQAGEEGEFDLPGLPPGAWDLEARTRDGRRGGVRSLGDGSVEIVLQE